MNANERSTEPQPEPISFSLGALSLGVSCVGVAMLAFRIFSDGAFATSFAVIFVGAFLFLWYLATSQFNRLRFPGWILIFGLALLVPSAWPRAGSGPPSPRAECGFNLKQIGLALLSYHQKYGSFPPAFVADANGKPLYSWRVLILPEMDRAMLAK